MEFLLSTLSQYGWGLFILLLIIYLIIDRVRVSIFNFIRTKFKIKLHDDEEKEHLRLHTFFSNINFYATTGIYSMVFEKNKPVKNALARSLLISYILAVRDMCETLIEDLSEDWSPEKWNSEVHYRVASIANKMNQNMKNDGIPDSAASNFNSWMAYTFDLMQDHIGRISVTKIYPSNVARTYTLFLAINIIVVSCLLEAERTFQYLDWGVSGKYYKDMLIED